MQLMILLSALLASLSGLMVGESRVAPAQVELSAESQLAPSSEQAIAVARVLSRADTRAEAVLVRADQATALALPARNGRTHLSLKQSWLI
ncbi:MULTISPECIES: hypothetical protein [Sphingobium]|uniref:hypothetical protein n=1 Tax=Sphingobium TaxID=165695 RepID=UPI0015EB9782|nr:MULTISPECIES: hypothetical protein [Sphingobium]MCW2361567.1 hypothetical protein [Sphingobium sp. B10D3B]MCW2401754.1 hypothetical protein [Sphingobium sp. B10D7B]MCW2366636.1 hypothetical protein [Sphingobium sp. B7D2B]MCW2384781.1 hypothetical protein [Sphingobium sp. B2D3D]MCW2408733.1 hypothetical protein [Sphingobium xanthum]